MLFRSLFSILVLPLTMTAAVPFLILSVSRAHELRQYWMVPFFAGACFIMTGLVLVGWTIWLFAAKGRGTLAPWDPPQRLVVNGPYRHVRNPMISGVLCILAGEALMFMSAGLLIWVIAFFTINAVYIPSCEEPALERRFGDEYTEYKRNVPRWIPRCKAWRLGDN